MKIELTEKEQLLSELRNAVLAANDSMRSLMEQLADKDHTLQSLKAEVTSLKEVENSERHQLQREFVVYN